MDGSRAQGQTEGHNGSRVRAGAGVGCAGSPRVICRDPLEEQGPWGFHGQKEHGRSLPLPAPSLLRSSEGNPRSRFRSEQEKPEASPWNPKKYLDMAPTHIWIPDGAKATELLKGASEGEISVPPIF